jgi:death on curing protein
VTSRRAPGGPRVSYFTLDEVLAVHAHQIARYGGALGVRDRGLLESALAMPSVTFSGQDLHATFDEKAAAYLFHLVKNHPFVDGNKRVGLAVCLAFLRLNGVRVEASDDDLVELVLGVARGRLAKAEVAVFLVGHGRLSGSRRRRR